jgi:hypothetical protein
MQTSKHLQYVASLLRLPLSTNTLLSLSLQTPAQKDAFLSELQALVNDKYLANPDYVCPGLCLSPSFSLFPSLSLPHLFSVFFPPLFCFYFESLSV